MPTRTVTAADKTVGSINIKIAAEQTTAAQRPIRPTNFLSRLDVNNRSFHGQFKLQVAGGILQGQVLPGLIEIAP